MFNRKTTSLIATTVFAAAMGFAANVSAYDGAGSCSDAVVDSCNGKHKPGDALESCVNNGVKQCLAAYPVDDDTNAKPGHPGNLSAGEQPKQHMLLPAVQQVREAAAR